MPIYWNIPLVLLSVLVAVIGSFAALAHAQRMRESSGRAVTLWMLAGAFTLALAIWSMHFIGMLAFHLPIRVAFDPSLSFLSILPAIAASFLSFRVLREPSISAGNILVSGIFMGVGISVMHYTGMAALKLSPPISYDPLIFGMSVAIAVIASWGALLMMYQGEHIRMSKLPRFALGAVIMGSAIAGMHYTAIVGAHIQPGSVCLVDATRGIEPNILALLVSLISIFWFGGGVLASLFEQRNSQTLSALELAHEERQQLAERQAAEISLSLRDSRESLQRVLDSVAEGIYGVDMDGR
ncbi:MAG TPA: MHYT domain-containing protein, partial [Gallionella sp.]|nr:MHYT domain-containing protein [Gallionella sp.]